MPDVEFFRTRMGSTFFNGHVPTLLRHLGTIATEMKRANDLKEAELHPIRVEDIRNALAAPRSILDQLRDHLETVGDDAGVRLVDMTQGQLELVFQATKRE